MVEEEQKSTPQHLYHYYRVTEHTEAIFTKNEIYFASPLNYNDPFDTKIAYIFYGPHQNKAEYLAKLCKRYYPGKSTKEIREFANKPSMHKVFVNRASSSADKNLREHVGIFCLSEINNNTLMWSHYTDSHKGFCLEFSTRTSFFQKTSKIIYQKELPIYNILKEPLGYERTRLLFIKANDWAYEKEWRLLNFGIGPGIYKFPSEALTGIIFGCRITPENKEKIINWCRQRNPKPQLYDAVPKKTEYGLDIVPFDYPA